MKCTLFCVYIYIYVLRVLIYGLFNEYVSSPYYKASINCVVSQMDKSEMMIESRRLDSAFDGAHLIGGTNYFTRYFLDSIGF
jgi:hypothetical protein